MNNGITLVFPCSVNTHTHTCMHTHTHIHTHTNPQAYPVHFKMVSILTAESNIPHIPINSSKHVLVTEITCKIKNDTTCLLNTPVPN